MGVGRPSRRELLGIAGASASVALSGCSLGFGSESTVDIDTGLYPPGTDESGITDPETLFDAHLAGLSSVSYAYEQTFDPGRPGEVHRIAGRQQGSLEGPRFLRSQVELADAGADPDYRMEHTATTDAWHGPGMPVDLEYRRIHEATEVSNVDAYEDRSRYAEAHPPGERTEYERHRFNSLTLSQKDYVRGLTLLPLSYRPTGSATEDGTTLVRFAVDGFSEQARYRGRADAGGELLVRSDGVVRECGFTLRERAGDEEATASTTISELGEATVRDEPAWVRREFEEGSSG